MCLLYVLQTLLAPHSTLQTFGHTVVPLGIFRFSTCLDYVQRWKNVSEFCCFQTLMWEFDVSLFGRKVSSKSKNAFHGNFGSSYSLEASLCFQVTVHRSFEL